MKSVNRFLERLQDSAEELEDRLLLEAIESVAVTLDLLQNNELLIKIVNDYAALEKKYFELNQSLIEKQEKIKEDLEAASAIQKALLPVNIPQLEHFDFVWNYIPCEEMGGDLVNIIPYNSDNWIFYIIDVTGHGPKAAMVTVALSQFLNSSNTQTSVDFLDPKAVFAALELNFPFSRFESLYTIIYGVINLHSGEVKFCNSAHPKPVLISDNHSEYLERHDPMLGLGICSDFTETKIVLTKGQKLVLCTDGLTECTNKNGEQFGEEKLLDFLKENHRLSCSDLSEALQKSMEEFAVSLPLQDDFTCLMIEGKL
jgi:sigma-B regulation protein RsbU (phosphoserine phosphatase)